MQTHSTGLEVFEKKAELQELQNTIENAVLKCHEDPASLSKEDRHEIEAGIYIANLRLLHGGKPPFLPPFVLSFHFDTDMVPRISGVTCNTCETSYGDSFNRCPQCTVLQALSDHPLKGRDDLLEIFLYGTA